MKKGFTLVEVIMYITILSMLMTSSLMGMHYLIASSEKTKDDLIAIDDLLFIITKVKQGPLPPTDFPYTHYPETATEPEYFSITIASTTSTLHQDINFNAYPTP